MVCSSCHLNRSVRKTLSSSRSLIPAVHRPDAENFHTILYSISQATSDTMNPPKDHIFNSHTHLTIVPAAYSFGNSHGIFAQRICSRPGLIEYLLRYVVFSLILVCTSTSSLNIWPEEGEKEEHLEHHYCYQTVEHRRILFLLYCPMIVRLTLDNNPIYRLLGCHHLRGYSSLESYCLFQRKIPWKTSKKIANSVNV